MAHGFTFSHSEAMKALDMMMTVLALTLEAVITDSEEFLLAPLRSLF